MSSQKSKGEVIVAQPQSAIQPIDDERLKLIGSTLAPDLNPAELRLFGEVAMRSGLDPFAKQIFAVKRQGRVTFQTSIDGYRSIAARTGEYDGQDEPTFEEPCPCGNQPRGHPATATVRVYRKGMSRGVAATAHWHEYVPDAGPSGKGDLMWKKMPHVMLAKVAEALALRKGFPYVMADVYTAEEMEQAEGGNSSPPEAAPEAGGESGDGSRPTSTASTDDEPSYEGSVVTPLPDRVVEVKRPDWFVELPPEQSVAKVELKFTVGRSKHTAIVLGDFAFAVQEAKLAENDTVRVTGQRVEVHWREGMPTKKELRYVTRVDVLRDGDWQNIVPGVPLSEGSAASENPAPDAEPTSGSDTSADPTSPNPTESDTAATPADGIADGDFTEVAEQVFGEDAVPPIKLHDALKYPAATGEGTVDAPLIWLDAEYKTSGKGKTFALIHLTDRTTLWTGLMAEDEAEAQLKAKGRWKYATGSPVRIIGTWQATNAGDLVMLTAVTDG